MGLTIGICDDCQTQTELIEGYLAPYKVAFDLRIMISNNPILFLRQLETQSVDLFFLDIDMGTMDGIALGSRLKTQYPEAVIVYITGHEHYAVKAFQVRAFHYLLKPLAEERFVEVFLECAKSLQKKALRSSEKKLFKYQKKGVIGYLEYDQILYFEKIGRNVLVRTVQGPHEFPCHFSQLLCELDQEVFMQCHQGYIIHKSMVRSYLDKNLILKGDFKVPISRSYANKVRVMLEEKLFSREELI